MHNKLEKEAKISKQNKRFNITTFHTLKINYFGITKGGNSSIKSALLRADKPNRDTSIHIHDPRASSYITKSTPLNNGYTNFTILRDPYTRIISMYKDYVVNNKGNKYVKNSLLWPIFFFKDAKLKTIAKQDGNKPTKDGLNAFVKMICQYPDEWLNIHFRSQYFFISHNDTIIPSLILKLENIKRSIDIGGQRFSIAQKNTTKGGQDLAPSDLSEDAKAAIGKKYKKDFDLWEKAT
jgi:hypothetical protein